MPGLPDIMNTSTDKPTRLVPRDSQTPQIQEAAREMQEQARFRRRILYSAGFIALTAIAATVGYQNMSGGVFRTVTVPYEMELYGEVTITP